MLLLITWKIRIRIKALKKAILTKLPLIFDNPHYLFNRFVFQKSFIVLITMLFLSLFPSKALPLENQELRTNNQLPQSIDLLSGSDWKENWEDLTPTSAVITPFSNGIFLTGSSKTISYGCVYKDIRIDLDDYPEIEISVGQIKGSWYLLIYDQSLPGGYVHLQRNISASGTFKYNLKKITGYKRIRTLRLQLGISSGSTLACEGMKAQIRYLRLNKIYGINDETSSEERTFRYIPEAEKNLKGWQANYPDGASTGATIDFDGDTGIVSGTSKQFNYGFVYRDCKVNLSQFPVLAVSINHVTEGWYLFIYNDELPDGYQKLERYNSKTGIFQYDLNKILGWKGLHRFWVSIGPVIEKSMIKSNIGQHVSFDYFKFQNQVSLPATNAKILSFRTLATNYMPGNKRVFITNGKPANFSSVDINTVSIKNSFFPSEPFQLKNQGVSVKRVPVEPTDLSNFRSLDLLNRTPLIFNKLAMDDPGTGSASQAEAFKFVETNNLLLFRNSFAEIALDKQDGSFVHIKDRRTDREIISENGTGLLWRLNFRDGSALSSKEIPFQYSLEKEGLILNYGSSSELLIRFEIASTEKGCLDFKIKIFNKSEKDILNFIFPETMTFHYQALRNFILPFKLGLSLNKNFYFQKKQFSGKYPNLFADFVSLRIDQTSLSLYRIPGKGKDEMFIPADIETGFNPYDGGMGFYTHRFNAYIQDKSDIILPTMRFNFTDDVLQAADDYAVQTGIRSSPSLADKLGTDIFEKLRKSVLLKLDISKNRDFDYISSFIKYLSAPTLIHLVTFWKGGFDKNYPDYLPPDEAFGTQNDLKRLCMQIDESGNLVMPYTNPTWWHESSSIMQKIGTQGTVLRDLNGTFLTESYNNSTGYIMNPFSSSVNESIDQTALDFRQEAPSHILFEDQLGARSWLYGSGEDLPVPHAYIQGIINIAKRGSQNIPLFTEDGFDRLIPYESGFCNMSFANALPPDDAFNTQFGKENWSLYPLTLFWAHDKIAFYQHNLAHEVFADSVKKITWDMLYGHNLNIGRWVSAWPQQIKDYKIADVVQKEIISRCFGKKLILYKEIDDKVFLSQYEDMMIIGNFSEDEYKIDRYSIASGGFLAFDKQGTLFAGYFKKFNGETLSMPHLLIIKKKDDELWIKQPDSENCFLTLPRPGTWFLDSNIEMFYDNDRMPFVADRKGITCYLKYGQDEGWYRLKYNSSKQTGFDLRASVRRQEDQAIVRIEALCFQPFENLQIGVKTFLVNSVGEIPRFDTGNDNFKTQPYQKIKAGEKIICSFPVSFEQQWQQGSSVWLDISLYSKDKKLKQISSMIKMSDIMDLVLSKKSVSVSPEEKTKIPLTIYNYSEKILKGKVLCQYPENVSGASAIEFEVEPNDTKAIESEITAGKALSDRMQTIQYKIIIGSNEMAEAQLNVRGILQKSFMDIQPISTLLVHTTNRLRLNLSDLPEKLSSCRINFSGPQDWAVSGIPQEWISLNGKNFLSLDFVVVPGTLTEDFINFQVTGQDLSIKLHKKFKSFSSNQTCLLAGDVNNDQTEDIVLANSKIELTVTPIIGGRILKIVDRQTGHNQLFCDYPGTEISEGSTWHSWTEYGGLNDWWPSGWPGDVWNNRWSYRIVENGKTRLCLELSSQSVDEKMEIIKQIELYNNRNDAHFSYEFRNHSDSVVNFFYNSHPDLAPGGEASPEGSDQIIIPLKTKTTSTSENTIVYKTYNKSLSKAQYVPGENWCIALDKTKNEYIGQIFDLEKTDQIGVYQGVNFFSMEILSKNFFLDPAKTAYFNYWIFAGHSDWEKDLAVLRKSWNIKKIQK